MSYIIALILIHSSIHVTHDESVQEACMDVLSNDVTDQRLHAACSEVYQVETGEAFND